ncbi:hypothetical protein [Kitasatospora sp. NPDC050467]|uniref:hypothetical protein n=1 Tax=unclassified Kitasatospora TaxID=2633591 RepID=UPI0037A071E8
MSGWHHPVEFAVSGSAEYDVYGSMCYESDLFAERVPGPRDLRPGDLVLVGAAGGYDIPSANVWVRPRPTIYALTGSAAEPIRLREPGTEIR